MCYTYALKVSGSRHFETPHCDPANYTNTSLHHSAKASNSNFDEVWTTAFSLTFLMSVLLQVPGRTTSKQCLTRSLLQTAESSAGPQSYSFSCLQLLNFSETNTPNTFLIISTHESSGFIVVATGIRWEDVVCYVSCFECDLPCENVWKESSVRWLLFPVILLLDSGFSEEWTCSL